MGAVVKYFYECVCLSVLQWGYLQNHKRDLCQIFCACCLRPWSSSDMFMIGCIACHREGVFFPVENALSLEEGGWDCTVRAKYAIYDCLVFFSDGMIQCLCKTIDTIWYGDSVSKIVENSSVISVVWMLYQLRQQGLLGSKSWLQQNPLVLNCGCQLMQVDLYTHTHTQPFYGPFSGTTWVSWCQKRTSGLYGARGD